MKVLVVAVLAVLAVEAANAATPLIRQRCGTPPAAPIRIEKAINECLEDIKLSLDEALSELDASAALVSKDVKGRQPGKSRAKRQTFSEDERSIAGCFMHCVHKKAKALNADGVPTGEGLVKLYAEGSQDANFFLATAQAVNHCMGTAQQQGRLLPQALREPEQQCYLAYDLFECITDQVVEYCGTSP